ncbi:MAG: hypothetical protein CSA42_01045 [Gammaproteobacteria bacterium]|nr:MAG: hypothetical protein CSA42_01045 [Gammaproteobacteria bacterium]
MGLTPKNQGLYVLRDSNCNIKYVGRGNVKDRLAKHAKKHADLTFQVIYDTGDLSYAEAKGLEAKVMGKFGGPSKANPDTGLRNKYRAFANTNKKAKKYRDAANKRWKETQRKLKKPC